MTEVTLLDRGRELEILTLLSGVYPNKLSANEIAGRLSDPLPESCDEFIAECHYLFEHDLIDISVHRFNNGIGTVQLIVHSVSITAKGMDFLRDDGGLSAILGLVTVKLHDDTIKALLIDKVNASDGDTSVKEQTIAAIKALPAEATKSIAMKMIDLGIAATPATLAGLQKLLGL